MRAAHDSPDVGHPAYRPMLLKIRETMWWPQMPSNVRCFTDACDACQRSKRGQDPAQPEPQPFKHRLPNSEVTIDVVEGMVKADNGWQYVVCIVCSCSRYLEYFGCEFNNSESIVDALVHWICNGRGFPRTIKHSQDASIVSAAVSAFKLRLGLSSKTEHAYSPHLISVNERPHKELGNYLRIHTQSNPTRWHLMLPWAQYVHNASVNRITGCTPLYLEMGNPKETMVEATHLPELTSDMPLKDVALERVRYYCALSKGSRAKDLEYHREAIQRQQRNMDISAKVDTLTVGTSVLVHLPWVSKGLNSKLADKWHGPFKITAVLQNAYMLQDSNENSETSQLIKVAKGRVRRYRTLQGDLTAPEGLVKRIDGVQDWIMPGLFNWKAALEPELDVVDVEPEVEVAPHQVTVIMLDLTKNNQAETEEQWKQRVSNQCSMLSAQYNPEGFQPHPSVSTAYLVGDYGALIHYISLHPWVIHELVGSLEKSELVTMFTNTTVTSPGSSCIPSDSDIIDHYVLAPHEGQLRGRNLDLVDPSYDQYPVVVYCTVAGDSISKLAKWTSLLPTAFSRAPLHLQGFQQNLSIPFTNKSTKLPPNTWVIVDTTQFGSYEQLKGTWHRYDPVECNWHHQWGPPTGIQASQSYVSQDQHQVRYILMLRPSTLEETDPELDRAIIRWEGEYAESDQYDVVSEKELNAKDKIRM